MAKRAYSTDPNVVAHNRGDRSMQRVFSAFVLASLALNTLAQTASAQVIVIEGATIKRRPRTTTRPLPLPADLESERFDGIFANASLRAGRTDTNT